MNQAAIDWQRIETLFPDLLPLTQPERTAFLDRHCANDPALRRELESLLQNAGGESPVDSPPTLTSADAQAEDELLLPPGARLGVWQVGELIGRGGMGEVYAARRADGTVEQEAAVKVLRRGLETAGLLRRFRRERRILAQLSHPNIAHLLDAGATADRRPFLVMERVRGVPVDQWAAGRSVREAAGLMRSVCEAVHAAHRSLVVHRDLKPTNVLVTADGTVKLLDFGIAKLLDDEDPDATRIAADPPPMTPSYAAPELLRGEPATTSSDVYALGVMLHVLLTGALPHGRLGIPAALAVQQLDQEVRPPSAMLKRSADPALKKRAREVAGDLDRIVQRALDPQAERRYLSAQALAGDLQRWSDGLPVAATPDRFAYRAGKFVRRNPALTAAAGAVVLAVAAGVAGVAWQAREARMQRDIALEQAQRAEAVQDALMHMMRVAGSPGAAASPTAQEVFDASAERVMQNYADDPQTAAGVLHALARLRLDLQDDLAAAPLFERAIALSPDAALLAELRWNLADIRIRQGRYDEARALVAGAVAFYDSEPERYRRQLLQLRREQARLAGHTGDLAGEQRMLAEAIAVLEAETPRDQEELARFLGSLATAHYRAGDFAQAYALQERSNQAWQASPVPHHVDALTGLGNQATNAQNLGRLEEARRRYESLIPLQRELYGNAAPWMNNYGAVLAQLGRPAEALAVLADALELSREEAGEEQIVTLNARLQIARAHLVALDPPRAIAMLEPALATGEGAYGPDHPFVAAMRHTLGAAWLLLGDEARAATLLEPAVEQLRGAGAAGSRFLSRALLDLARLRIRQDRAGEAAALAGESLDLRLAYAPDSFETGESRLVIGRALLAGGDRAGGIAELQQAQAILLRELGAEHFLAQRAAQALKDAAQ